MIGLLAALNAGSPAAQTNYPDKPIHVVVGFPPGGQPDTLARLLGQKLTDVWGKPIVVENVSGAAGKIATERVMRAAPDGYTLGLLGQGTLVVNPSLYQLPYDPVKDFAPISLVTVSPWMLVVHNSVPAKNVKELVAFARTQPGGLTVATAGTGSSPHMASELFKSMAGIDVRHIPYKGTGAAFPDLLSGRVTAMFGTMPAVLPMVREGKLRALAVTSLKRSPAAPDLPTVAESGYPGFEFTNWFGLFAPTGTSAAIIRTLHLETVKALALRDVHAKLAAIGMDTIGSSPDELTALIKSELPKRAKVIKEAGIKAD